MITDGIVINVKNVYYHILLIIKILHSYDHLDSTL